MRHLHAVVRIEKKTKRAILFYRCTDGNGLECYTLEEQHSAAVQEYYNDDTRPAGSDVERTLCAALARHYATRLKLYDDIELKVGARLPFKS